jgi:hypothetical protein
VDAAGAEVLRQRIEAYNTAGRGHESAVPAGSPAAAAPSTPAPVLNEGLLSAHDYLDDDESDIFTRPALQQWIAHHERTLNVAPPLEHTEIEANGGGAGALNRRILEEQKRPRLARPTTDRRAEPYGRRVDEPHRAPEPRRRDSGLQLPTVALATGLAIIASMVTSLSIVGLPHTSASTTTGGAPPADAAAAAPPLQALPATDQLRAVASFNPYGTGPEHGADVAKATDGNAVTYWSTETYLPNGFEKPGTGLVLAASHTSTPARVELVTDTPGYQAQIRIGDSPTGGFTPDSAWKTVGARTVFTLRGQAGRYLVVWIRLPGHAGRAHVNEVSLRN